MNKKVIFLFLLSVLLNNLLFGQQIIHYDNDDGLMNGTINAFERDSLGYMWIGSDQGLKKFSGSKFQSYSYNFNNQIDEIRAQDIINVNGEIFLINAKGHLMKYDYSTDDFKLIYSNPSKRFLSLGNLEDRYLLIGASNALILYELESNNALIYQNNLINREVKVHNNLLYSATPRGLVVYSIDENKNFLKEKTYLINQDIIDFDFNSQNKLWVGTEIGGLFVIEDSNLISVNLGVFYNKSYAIRKINFDQQDNALVAIDRLGLFVIDDNYKVVKIYSHDVDDNNSISQNSIYAIHIDKLNNYWLGVREGGVNIIKDRENTFENISHIKNLSNSLPNNNVRSIVESNDREVLFGTENGLSGIKNGFWCNYNSLTKLNNTAILAMSKYKDKLILGTYGEGLFTYNNKNKTTKKLKINFLKPNSFIFHIEVFKDDLWVSNSGGPLLHYRNLEFVHAYSKGLVRDLIKTPSGLIYCISDTGFHQISSDTNQTTTFFSDIYNSANLGYSLFYNENKNKIFIGGKNGLYSLKINNDSVGSLHKINDKVGVVYSIQYDKSNHLFLGCSTGLWSFNLESEQLRKFDSNDGVFIPEFGFGASTQLNDGRLLFGGPKGAVCFDPKKILPDKSISNLMITDFKINGKSVDRTVLDQNINYTDHIKLSSSNNSISFSFDAVKLQGSNHNSFEWQLLGHDSKIKSSDGSEKISYNNLDSGDYELKYSVFNADGIKQIERTKHITILPPIWATPTAFLFYVLVLILLSYLGFLLYRNNERKKFNENRIKFFVEVAHDIRTPVSLIQLLVKQLSSQKNTEKSIELIHRNAQNLNEYVTQLLDFQKIDRNQLKIVVSKVDLKDCLLEIVSDFKPLIEEKSLNIELLVNHIPVWIDVSKMRRIFYNLISNAIKYTQHGGEISIIAKMDERVLTINFIDNGFGIPEKQQELIFNRFTRGTNVSNKGMPGTGIGLMLSKKIVELHGGKIILESKENIGSKFTIELPSGTQHYKNDQISYEINNSSSNSVDELLHQDQTILLVEDNDELRQAIKIELEKYFNVIQAIDGKEGLVLALSKNPDIIVTDVMMPNVNGIELCKVLKSNFKTSHIPIIMLTALADLDDKIIGLETGADAYVEKPFNVSILLATIKNLLHSRQNITPLLKGENVTRQMTPDESFLSDIVEIIKSNLTKDDFSIDELGQMMGLSRSSLFRKIKSLAQISPSDLIIKIKLNRAEELLKSNKFSRVSEIAYESGFKDPKYFSTLFKKHYGKTPKEFMQN
jgi:signal transduction histidine kinase/DNA-binding response OmpR family regulator/ligand-binding sensor domain-containing protein